MIGRAPDALGKGRDMSEDDEMLCVSAERLWHIMGRLQDTQSADLRLALKAFINANRDYLASAPTIDAACAQITELIDAIGAGDDPHECLTEIAAIARATAEGLRLI